MGVKKTMDTFFASMQEQSMAGYGGRLVNTPMGPFRWNETMQLWENVNNGMVMNNISFQDTIMMDYGTSTGGDNGNVSPFVCNYSITNVVQFPDIVIDGDSGYDYDACIIPGTIRTTENTCPVDVYLYLESISGDSELPDKFSWIYRLSYPATFDAGRPLEVGSVYSSLSPLSTKITLNPNSVLGFGQDPSPLTNFVLFGKYTAEGTTVGSFKARLINETTDETIHEVTINFNNLI